MVVMIGQNICVGALLKFEQPLSAPYSFIIFECVGVLSV